MRNRILFFFLASLVLLGSVFSCLPMWSSAIVPVGLVQSALASYIASTGYKLWNENGTGDQLLNSLAALYDGPFLAFAESSLGVNIEVNDLSYYASNDMVYLDSSGQIVIRKAAADMFQQFADWIQSEYDVQVGSSSPTQVLAGSGGSYTNGSGLNCFKLNLTTPIRFNNSNNYFADLLIPIGDSYTDGGLSTPVYVCSQTSQSIYATAYNGYAYYYAVSNGNFHLCQFWPQGNQYITVESLSPFAGRWYKDISIDGRSNLLPVSTSDPVGQPIDDLVVSGGVASLGVSLAQAVTDVIGQAQDDDAVVIGVGAGVGSTAQDIADLVAQGVKAQTLNPSVSITAESVIDTPVQPYPDIDGLGLPQLGAALVERFPFCIPWDFVDTVRLLNADPVAPNIAVDLFPAGFKSKVGITGSTEFHINLGDEKYAKIGTFCRWGSLIGFCFGLAILTKRMIWTA